MKVLICSIWPINKYSIGGTERYVLDLADGLIRAGMEVDVLMLTGKKIKINEANFIPIKIKGIDKIDEFNLRSRFIKSFTKSNLSKLANHIESQFNPKKYDLIHLNSLLFWFLFKDKKRVFTLHENPIEFERNWGKNSLESIIDLINSNYNNEEFVVPSEYYAKEFNNLLGKRMSFIPHAIRTNRFSNNINKNKLLKKYNLKTKAVKIMVPGRLDIEQKGQDIAVNAIKNAKRFIQSEIEIIFTGIDDQYIDNVYKLKQIADKYMINLHFIKFKNMAEAYKISDIIMLPSRFESFGYTALESLSLSKKVILSDIPTFKEIAKGNPNAYISKLNPKSFSNKLVEIINTPRKKIPKNWKNIYTLLNWSKKNINIYNKFN